MLQNQRREIRENLQGDTSIVNPVTRTGVGGLNLVDGALTTPLTDASISRNMVVGNDGVLRRRPGTEYLQRLAFGSFSPSGAAACNMTSVTTPRGHDFLFFRLGRVVGVRNIRQNEAGATQFVHNQGFNVLRQGSRAEGNFLVLRDPTIRVLLFTPENPTLEVRVNELRLASAPSSGNDITFPASAIKQLIPGVYEDQGVIKEQFCVFIGGARRTVTNLTESGGNITLTTSFTFDGSSYTIDVQHFQSHWWAEAEMYYGDRFSDTVTRTNLTEDDLHLAVPSNLRDGLDQRGTGLYAPYTLDAMYWNGSQYVFYTQMANGLPTTAVQFAMSDGSARRDNSPVVPSPLFLTYGDDEPGVVRPVTLTRHRVLNTRGGEGSAGANLEVYVDEERLSYSGSTSSAGFASYRLWDDTDSAQVTNINTTSKFISLDGQYQTRPQVNPSSVVRIVEFNNPFAPASMTRVPAYGLTEVCDYGRGSFPSCGATYQNRLAIAGMPHDPLLVSFSALYDSRTPQEPYMYFQNDPLDLQPDSGAFQVRLDSTADDRIISLQEFQGSLFAITYRKVFRIAAAGRAVITSSNYFVSSVASIGAVNSNAIARPEGGIAFLSPRGVFAIVNGVQSNEATEYKLIELSTKISPVFDPTLSTKGPNKLWWMSYASDERRLYVGISTEEDEYHASELYTYDSINEAWGTMDTVGGFRSFLGIDIALERDRNQHYLLVDIFTKYEFHLIATGRPNHLDYQRISTDLINYGRTFVVPRYANTQTNTIVRDITTYPDRRVSVYKVIEPMSPLTFVRDIRVRLNGFYLEPGVGYVKLPGNYIQLLDPPQSPVDLLIERVTPLSDGTTSVNAIGYLIDDLPDESAEILQEPEDVALNEYNQWTWVGPNTVYNNTWGVIFQSVWVSPVFTLGDITRDKRLSAVTLYCERIPGRDPWYGTNKTYNESEWPQLSTKDFAGRESFSTDGSTERQDAYIGILLDQEDTLTHPLQLGDERDFFTLTEGTTEELTTRPAPLQIPNGLALRRTFSDVVSVFQIVLTSVGQQPIGVSAVQVEAELKPSKQVHKSK